MLEKKRKTKKRKEKKNHVKIKVSFTFYVAQKLYSNNLFVTAL